ncbi:MAG: 4-hydroxythreonine-4-phosphate dehydrogenase PdxA [Acidobacteria bacterium]|nr:4-hydroxythreonine-4-phosphate dehydrogenase PdxA [Acidobacteriota bacterium]MXZ71468.1 4-hydroxythreonine-4-phosphate dehydrogenase PdxA [Acidobacteriota bacterium]MYJ06052.1 4-hydroxythreonine-4-phosphate dehydrogenase PdxA [Acidobacteriota bacterium]
MADGAPARVPVGAPASRPASPDAPPASGPSPRVAITTGDPAGIGPEIASLVEADPAIRALCTPVLYGPDAAEARRRFSPGAVSAEAGRTAYDSVVAAVRDARAGRVDAIGTAPINKAAWAAAGLRWRGHTDLLAHLTDARDVRMMFHADRLNVVLATVHVPLAEVPALLTPERIDTTIRLAHAELPRFGVARPRLALAGLNPHAGEGGLIGDEEQRTLAPAVERCRASGIDVTGPIPGDAVFRRAVDGEFDAVIACYHDQGLIPIKLIAFGEAVNVTLGLPIVRTSVDHGTGFDIAGKGMADPSGLLAAVRLAVNLVNTSAGAPASA